MEATRSGFAEGSIKTYGKAVRLIGEVWQRVTGTEMPALAGSPTERFTKALDLLESQLKKKQAANARTELHDASSADPDLQGFLDEMFEDSTSKLLPDIDDVSPNAFKSAAYGYVNGHLTGNEVVDVGLEEFLKWIAAELRKELGWSKRINVGQNRHFPRMLHWVRELEVDTTWDEGVGFKLMNTSGKGAVAKFPASPQQLKVRINSNFI